MTNMQIAQTILNQLGGTGRLTMMCGCKDYAAGDKSVSFRIGSNGNKVTRCLVTLDPSDTYTVKFYKGRGVNMKECYAMSDVYNDNLRSVFEQQTGMYLTF